MMHAHTAIAIVSGNKKQQEHKRKVYLMRISYIIIIMKLRTLYIDYVVKPIVLPFKHVRIIISGIKDVLKWREVGSKTLFCY